MKGGLNVRTSAEQVALIRQRRAEGIGAERIAGEIGMNVGTLRKVMQHLGMPASVARPADGGPTGKIRACLMCRDDFTSRHAGERVCEDCKKTGAWQSGLNFGGGGTGSRKYAPGSGTGGQR